MISSMFFSLFSTLSFLGAAAPSGIAASPVGQMLPMIVIFFIACYFLLIRPQQKQQKEHQNLISSLKTGDKVVTVSGIHGMIANVKERSFVIKVADNVKMEFDKSAVASRLSEASAKKESSEEGEADS